MSHFNIVRILRKTVVRPSKHGVRLIGLILAFICGLSGHFMETSPQLKELDLGDVVEQIHATIERRETIKELSSEFNHHYN